MSVPALPSAMKALVVESSNTAVVQDIPVPTISDNEILVRTAAIALNPADWKLLEYAPVVGTIPGGDWAGHIIQVGANVSSLKIGDAVAGFVQGGYYINHGAFAEYVKTAADLVWKIPIGVVSCEQAATMNATGWTAAEVLYNPRLLGLVEPSIDKAESSVGMYLMQLAHASGYKVATVASPRNFKLCQSFGADVVFDYNDPEAINKIKEATNNSLHIAVDTISETKTQVFTVKVFGPGPGRFITLLPPDKDAQAVRNDIIIQDMLIYTTLGEAFSLFGQDIPAIPEDRAFMVIFLKKYPELVSSGSLKPNPVKLLEGGLSEVPAGLHYMKEGKNSGKKIVFRI